MARGGKRPGAGRKPGSLTKKTRDIAEAAAAAGETPLEFLLRIMRDETQEPDVRRAMAVAAAPYCHSRLASTQVTGSVDSAITVEIRRFTYESDELLNASPRSPRLIEGYADEAAQRRAADIAELAALRALPGRPSTT
jgi:hypothetical protein